MCIVQHGCQVSRAERARYSKSMDEMIENSQTTNIALRHYTIRANTQRFVSSECVRSKRLPGLSHISPRDQRNSHTKIELTTSVTWNKLATRYHCLPVRNKIEEMLTLIEHTSIHFAISLTIGQKRDRGINSDDDYA